MDHEPEKALTIRITFQLDGELEEGQSIELVESSIFHKLHQMDFNVPGHFKVSYTDGEYSTQRGRNWPKEK